MEGASVCLTGLLGSAVQDLHRLELEALRRAHVARVRVVVRIGAHHHAGHHIVEPHRLVFLADVVEAYDADSFKGRLAVRLRKR